MAAKSKQGQGIFRRFFARIGRFFLDMKAEVKKVVWPTPKQVLNNLFVVLVFVFFATLFIAALDALFTWGIAMLLKWAEAFTFDSSSSVSSVAAAVSALLA